MIECSAVAELMGRWWCNYDQGNFEVMESLLTEDVHFSSRTDSGTTAYEEFVRADHRGRDAVMAWQREHRLDSPYPLRHMGLNLHLTAQRDGEVRFSSYILVSQIADGAVGILSTAVVEGTARREAGELRLSEVSVVLDTTPSVPLRSLRPSA